MLTELYAYYIDHPEAMSREYVALIEKKGVPKDRAVCDWLSGMTDQYSMKKIQGDFHTKSLGGLLERGQNSCNEI